MDVAEPLIPSARLLDQGSKLYPSNMLPCSTETLLDCDFSLHSFRVFRWKSLLYCYKWELASRKTVNLSTHRKKSSTMQWLICSGVLHQVVPGIERSGLSFVLGCRSAYAKVLEACVNLTQLQLLHDHQWLMVVTLLAPGGSVRAVNNLQHACTTHWNAKVHSCLIACYVTPIHIRWC